MSCERGDTDFTDQESHKNWPCIPLLRRRLRNWGHRTHTQGLDRGTDYAEAVSEGKPNFPGMCYSWGRRSGTLHTIARKVCLSPGANSISTGRELERCMFSSSVKRREHFKCERKNVIWLLGNSQKFWKECWYYIRIRHKQASCIATVNSCLYISTQPTYKTR